jgi:hypothetical protein
LRSVKVGGGTFYNYYYYDDTGSITGFEYNGTPYYFLKNIQGDVVKICNGAGAVVAEHKYDVWGNTISITGTLASSVGQKNPFRYKG